MRFLEPAVTCILATNGKPTLAEALASIVTQTRLRDVQVIVLDAGGWLNDPEQRHPASFMRSYEAPTAAEDGPRIVGNLRGVYETYQRHPNIEWVFTGESQGHNETVCPIAYWTNRALGLATGRYVCTFYDDDLYYPTFFEQMAGRLDASPAIGVVWCTEVVSRLHGDGRREVLHEIKADHVRIGQVMDCQLDGMQVMFRRSLLLRMSMPWLDESPEDCYHSDGVFLNRLAALVPNGFHPVNHPLCEHRRTPWSTFTNHTI